MPRAGRFAIYVCFGVGIPALIACSLAGTQTTWLRWLGDYLVCAEKPRPADLIVVLGGEFFGNRVIKGAELGLQGYAKHVLISGPIVGNQKESDRAINFLVEKGYRRDLFVSFGHDAKSTIQEAYALKGAFEHFGAHRILVVTSAYHTRRTSIVFRGLVPGYEYRFIASAEEHFHPDRWWEESESRKYFYSEWPKIIATLLEVSWYGRL